MKTETENWYMQNKSVQQGILYTFSKALKIFDLPPLLWKFSLDVEYLIYLYLVFFYKHTILLWDWSWLIRDLWSVGLANIPRPYLGVFIICSMTMIVTKSALQEIIRSLSSLCCVVLRSFTMSTIPYLYNTLFFIKTSKFGLKLAVLIFSLKCS